MTKAHGLSTTRFYNIYRQIKRRTSDKTTIGYSRYGGRGIKCEWPVFKEFLEDMYQAYLDHVEEFGEQNTSIERIDNEGNYNKKNCRWATRKEQSRNRSSNRRVEFDGENLTLIEWCEKTGLKRSTFKNRIARGWKPPKLFEQPRKYASS